MFYELLGNELTTFAYPNALEKYPTSSQVFFKSSGLGISFLKSAKALQQEVAMMRNPLLCLITLCTLIILPGEVFAVCFAIYDKSDNVAYMSTDSSF